MAASAQLHVPVARNHSLQTLSLAVWTPGLVTLANSRRDIERRAENIGGIQGTSQPRRHCRRQGSQRPRGDSNTEALTR